MNKEKIKTIAIILLALVVVGVFLYFGYIAVYSGGYTQGYSDGGSYIVQYQTLNSKLFYYNESGSLREMPFDKLCGVVNG